MSKYAMRRGIGVSMRATSVSNYVKKLALEREEESVPRGTIKILPRIKSEVISPQNLLRGENVGKCGK